MGKMYLYSKGSDPEGPIKILEVSSSVQAKAAFRELKQLPGVSIGVFGARDMATLRRTQRTLDTSNVFKDLYDFSRSITE
ncbi:hypothetical protein [Guptibacillus sedimenti]|uniref:hypothetical protein n=1 Tax=Guptibacillus sedimenti TaxID=3025680 RepID=UPI0023624E5F|nr:hypothetical protein [Pseudalkalibacillus sedimenti]